MPRKESHSRIDLQLTPRQKAALDTVAQEHGLSLAQVVRLILAQHIPGFPDDFPTPGGNRRGE